MNTKICSKCARELPVSSFSKRSDRPCGVKSECRQCAKDRFDKWRTTNHDHVKHYREKTKARRLEMGKKWRARNLERVQDRRRERESQNQEQLKLQRKKYRKDNATAIKEYELKKKYGLNNEQYSAMYEAQKGLCLICNKPERMMQQGALKPLCVDHDHNTGVVRGLLCHRCNAGLGHFNDSLELVKAAAGYLENFSAGRMPGLVEI